jgi:hypothetical protein
VYRLHAREDEYLVRREWLQVSIGALAVLLTGCGHWPLSRRLPQRSWSAFVEDLVPEAESVFAKQTDEHTYVRRLATMLQRVGPQRGAMGGRSDRRTPHVIELGREQRFLINQYEIPERRGFSFHDHRDHNGVLLVLNGRVRIRGFDFVTSAPGVPLTTDGSEYDLLIRETFDHAFRPGECSSVTALKDNIHDVRALEGGCTLVDVFTWMGPDPRSTYLEV